MSTDAASEAMSPETFAERVESDEELAILDVRDRDAVDAWRVEGPGVSVTHVPHVKFVSARVTGDADELVDPDESYVVVCPRGEASDEVARTLREARVDAVNLAGGLHAWAQVYRAVELPVATDAVDVVQFQRPASGCLGSLLVADGDALVVDPLRAFADRYVEAAAERDVSIESVLDTHVHADHVSGLREVADAADATPILSATAVERGVTYDVETVANHDEIALGEAVMEVLATPGHTTGSISLRTEDLLLTGDALFLDGAPRPDLEAGEEGAADHAHTLHETLTERLVDVPDETLVAPGHYVPGTAAAMDGSYTARLGELRTHLSAFSESTDQFVERVLDSMGERPANFERIVAVNLGRETAGDDEAFEMELGPNNCAVTE